jgi:hypothetical protein
VNCPPDEEHWRVAAANTFVSHLAMLEAQPDGSDPTTWLGRIHSGLWAGGYWPALDGGSRRPGAVRTSSTAVTRGLRRDLPGRDVRYVLAWRLPPGRPAIGRRRADQAAARLHRRCRNRLSAGKGAKGERNYHWAWLRITPPAEEAGRASLAARASQHHHRRARLLPVLVARAHHARHTRPRRQHAVERRGVLPSGQRRGRPGPAPSSAVGILVPLHHPLKFHPRTGHRGFMPRGRWSDGSRRGLRMESAV